MLGDVMVPGLEPPSRPVRMYREGARSGGAGASAAAAGGTSRASDAPGEAPRLTAPHSYALVFRDSSQPELTLWRPVPGRGYVEVCGTEVVRRGEEGTMLPAAVVNFCR